MTHQLLFYDYVENIVERRAPHRGLHLELAKRWRDDGKLLYGGAFGDPPEGGLLIFSADADVEAFTSDDPYVKEGLVTSFRVVPWNEVVS
jgi:uncharacterized protein YciI